MSLQVSKASCFTEHVNSELDRLGRLETNWDAEGAPRIDPRIIQAARVFAGQLPEQMIPIPAVVPSAEGTLQFEWNEGERSLELEVETPSTIHYLRWHPKENIEEEDIFHIDDIARATSLIHWFRQGSMNA